MPTPSPSPAPEGWCGPFAGYVVQYQQQEQELPHHPTRATLPWASSQHLHSEYLIPERPLSLELESALAITAGTPSPAAFSVPLSSVPIFEGGEEELMKVFDDDDDDDDGRHWEGSVLCL